MPDEADELIGCLVDERYKVLEAMASGSMGAVYKAERVPVGKLVAVKFLHASFANDNEFQTRFERETRVMSKLAHPNCVSVVDFGVWDKSPYIVMEYVGGTTLRAMIDLGPVVPARALAIARQIASGLAHAHAQGIVHRDVKPANIMISEEIGTGEHVRILDFGLARLRGAVGRDATQSNVVVGTPNYMAPEQTVGGGTIDARTDLYAVGVVLFEMIAGERPFQAEDTLALLGMHRAAPIPKLADRAKPGTELPEGLQQVIEKAMAKSPDDRYQSAIELAEALDEVAGTRSEPRLPVIRRKTDPAAVAPTLQVDVGSGRAAVAKIREKKSGSFGTTLLAVLVLGGGAAAAWYIIKGRDSGAKIAVNGSGAPGSSHELVGSPDAMAGGSAIEPPPAIDAPIQLAPPIDAPEVGSDALGEATVVPDAAVGSGGMVGSGGEGSGGEIEMAPDPVTAENPSKTTVTAEDEAADAPETTADVDKRVPQAPVLAASIDGALQQMKDGKAELAISSLRALGRKNPRSAYIPFLLGNLYYDKLWWSVAIDQYRAAIVKNGGYRSNPTLIRNMIRMLASKKTVAKADWFIRKTIGKPALPFLRSAAKYDSNPSVKRFAAIDYRALGGK